MIRELSARSGIVILGLAMLAAACGDIEIGVDLDDDGITGSGALTTRTFDLRDFRGVQLSHAFDADVAYADAFAVSVTVDDNLVDRLVVETRGTTLFIGLDPGTSLRRGTLDASIAMPQIERLELSGASRARLSGFAPMQSLEVEASGASTTIGEIATERLDANLSGASRIEMTGTADEATLDASGASRLELDGFEIATATIRLSGASSGDVYVTDRLEEADLSGASYLTYRGDPELGDVTTSGGARISGR